MSTHPDNPIHGVIPGFGAGVVVGIIIQEVRP